MGIFTGGSASYSSTSFLATSGVPQSSNLGPSLFLTFVNDFLHIISSECLAYDKKMT